MAKEEGKIGRTEMRAQFGSALLPHSSGERDKYGTRAARAHGESMTWECAGASLNTRKDGR